MSTAREKLSLQYRKQALMAMTPRDRLLLKLDLAWKAANEGNMNRVRQMLVLLKKSLSFKKNPFLALNALRIYTACEKALEEHEDFAMVAQTMFKMKRVVAGLQNLPDPTSPEVGERHRRVIEAKKQGITFFGQHGKHHGFLPKKKRRPATPETAEQNQDPQKT